MYECSFELNDQPMSSFNISHRSFDAFSGYGPHRNQRLSACISSLGPISPGEYFIVDRESGGKLGWFYDLFTGRSHWFALYANDEKIDDETWCGHVKRGNFRLHPKGPRGISQGCVVIDELANFHFLSSILRSGSPEKIAGTSITALGKVVVR